MTTSTTTVRAMLGRCEASRDMWEKRALMAEEQLATKPEPFGWYCELVHVKSGEVMNTNFNRTCPIEGEHRLAGYKWRATALYTK